MHHASLHVSCTGHYCISCFVQTVVGALKNYSLEKSAYLEIELQIIVLRKKSNSYPVRKWRLFDALSDVVEFDRVFHENSGKRIAREVVPISAIPTEVVQTAYG